MGVRISFVGFDRDLDQLATLDPVKGLGVLDFLVIVCLGAGVNGRPDSQGDVAGVDALAFYVSATVALAAFQIGTQPAWIVSLDGPFPCSLGG